MNINRVFILGNVVADPEVRMTPSGTPVANLRIATNRVFKDKSGQRQEQAEFHNIVVWGRQAEIIRDYVQRGKVLFVEGRLQTRSWEGQDGQKRWRTEVVAERVQLGPRGAGGGRPPATAVPALASAPEGAPEEKKGDDIPIIDEDTPMTFDDEEEQKIDPKDIPF